MTISNMIYIIYIIINNDNIDHDILPKQNPQASVPIPPVSVASAPGSSPGPPWRGFARHRRERPSFP